jgi:hypothetical protein
LIAQVQGRKEPCHARLLLLLAAALSLFLCGPAKAADIYVWIDPGHGSPDPGNLPIDNDPAHYEAKLNLQESAAVLTSLLNLGFNAALTRNDTLIITKARRWKIANGTTTNDVGMQATCQIFVSIHMNSNPARDSHPDGGVVSVPPAGQVSVGKTWPNPFSDRVAMSYVLPAAARVSTRVYDLRGRMVADLGSANMSEGPHQITWDGRTNSRREPRRRHLIPSRGRLGFLPVSTGCASVVAIVIGRGSLD